MPETLMEERTAGILGITGIVPDDHAHAGPLRKISKFHGKTAEDRPGWIPPDIAHDWDTNPYAYQTEEELMPAGGLHGKLLLWFGEVMGAFLETKGVGFLADTFMLYRDKNGVKQRISPDFLIIPFRSPPPSAYDLDVEPAPLATVEITSPKSHAADGKKKIRLYTALGISVCLVIDAITPGGKPRDPVRLKLWRKAKGAVREIQPDTDGYLRVPELHAKIRAEGVKLVVADIMTGEILRDNRQLIQSEARAVRKAEQANQRAEQERRRAEQANQRAEQANQRAERLAAKLREMEIYPDETE